MVTIKQRVSTSISKSNLCSVMYNTFSCVQREVQRLNAQSHRRLHILFVSLMSPKDPGLVNLLVCNYILTLLKNELLETVSAVTENLLGNNWFFDKGSQCIVTLVLRNLYTKMGFHMRVCSDTAKGLFIPSQKD